MSHLILCEVRRDLILLHMAYPTVAESMHSATWDFEAVADRIKHIFEQVVIVERSSVPSLNETTRRATCEMISNFPDCGRIDPHLAIPPASLWRDIQSAPH